MLQCFYFVGRFLKTTCCWIYQGSSYLRMLTTYSQAVSGSARELESDSKLRGLQRGLFGLRTVAYPSCLWLVTPYPPIPAEQKAYLRSTDCQSSSKRERPCRKSWRNRPLFPTHSTPVLHNTSSFWSLLTDGPLLREFIVFQVFSPQVTKINIYN